MTRGAVPGGILESGGGPVPRPHATRPRDAADVAEAVAQAHASRRTLRVRAAGTWLDGGRPVDADAFLELGDLTGIVEYVPGDLTLTARAGTPLAVLDVATAAHRQWLPLDPFGDPAGTLGATLATASCGPLGASIGVPRDLALGLEFVSGEGERIRGGGRVVKNVAGFDLVRLQVGAWGTLGVITEATVRLRGRPEVDRTVALPLPRTAAALGELARRLLALRGAPLALEFLDAGLASSLGMGDACALVRLSGNEDAVASQHAALGDLGPTGEVPGDVWAALRAGEPAASTVVRLSGAVAAFAATWQRAIDCATTVAGAWIHASPARGIARVIAPASGDSARLLRSARASGRCVVERAAPRDWAGIAAAASDPVSRRMRMAFDPAGILNPGIFGNIDA